ncbi:50S ribosomal protein L24 [Helicobacter didelphidarum]|uniref:Large ribosomal subunit protein uL24 n=1 Tax=Helicobacter didelphidarum TaxID=2040648 RepID=A0A3D8IQ71_9HELI|nr:50S ribosomal protein L24 [Helicobacter didelphidarum]RDU66784.1 50S ribosomal protein L24 [Helicobacter didelphidarum]
MSNKVKIKRGDNVTIIAGDDKGKTGEVVAVFPKDNKLIVKDCKVVKKAIKPTEENKKGGFIAKEMPIHISNVKKS